MIEPGKWEDFLQMVNRAGFAWRDILGQDRWEAWTPVRTSWTDVGTAPVVTGRYRRVGRSCQLQMQVVPGTSVATLAGTSYVALPVPAVGFSGIGIITSVTGSKFALSYVDVPNSRLYVGTIVATANTLTVWCEYEA